jgi:hypothetical protein
MDMAPQYFGERIAGPFFEKDQQLVNIIVNSDRLTHMQITHE